MKAIELLAPAGGMPQLKAALHFGADAIYGGLNAFGLRAFAGNFSEEELEQALALVHGAHKKFYLTLNVLPFDDELEELVETAKRAHQMGVDGAIVSDLGAFLTLREKVPNLDIHVSTQANTINAPAASFYYQNGATRVVLARELSLKRIKEIRQKVDENLEIEAFVHGAMCMSYSGRCMFSDHLTGRQANRGACAQPCRWNYHVVEDKRRDQVYEVEVTDRGTTLFSAYDLCMIEHIPEMIDAGIVSLKIEGRMKTAYYVANVVYAYRKALDIYLNEGEEVYKNALPYLKKELNKASHRLSNTGFFFGRPSPEAGADGVQQDMDYVADVLEYKEGALLIELKNRIHVGDTLELLSKNNVFSFEVEQIIDATTNELLQSVSVAGKKYYIPCEQAGIQGDFLRGQSRKRS